MESNKIDEKLSDIRNIRENIIAPICDLLPTKKDTMNLPKNYIKYLDENK